MSVRFDAVLRTPFAGPWRRFSTPVQIVSASHPAEIIPAFTRIERALADGLYAAGFVTYEAAAAFGLPVRPPASSLPLLAFGLFPPHHVERVGKFPAIGSSEIGEWQPSIDHDTYLGAIRSIKKAIEAGDTYQINFTFRLQAPFRGEPAALMLDLHAAQAGGWSAFVDAGRYAICSASPELFFLLDGRRIDCRPMKGTMARGWWAEQDAAHARELHVSAKNRAENVMIVDMVRNDLGRIATTGSVRVASLFDVERYPLQWQMTSRVEADAARTGLADLFTALFPSGSVTGAPKQSSMAIIRELESTPRGIYTGAIGYLSPRGRAHFSVAIRTAAIDRERETAEFGVGSGIVWDSVDRDEYEECLVKAAMLQGSRIRRPGSAFSIPAYVTGEHPDFRLLETIRWDPDGGFRLLERHLERLRQSAVCFGFANDPADVRALLEAAVGDLRGPSKIRVLLEHDGSVLCEALDLDELPQRPLRAALATAPIHAADVFLFHKTTRREVYEAARASRPDAEVVLLWNIGREVTEATDFNLVLDIAGRKVTPPLECGLLPGTFRSELLDRGEISEQRITVEDLQAAGGGWLINSVRGWVPFTI